MQKLIDFFPSKNRFFSLSPVRQLRPVSEFGGKDPRITKNVMRFRANPLSTGPNTRSELHPAPWVYPKEGEYLIKMEFRVPSERFMAHVSGHAAITQIWSGLPGQQRVLIGVSLNPSGDLVEVFVNNSPDLVAHSFKLEPNVWAEVRFKFGFSKKNQFLEVGGGKRLEGVNLIPLDGYDYFRPKFGIYGHSHGSPYGVDFRRFLFKGEFAGKIVQYSNSY